MAPFDNPPSGDLTTKISTQVDGQLPDFIQSDHPIFSKFLKSYYEYLESGELRVKVTIDNLILELETESHVLAPDGSKVVLESGAGTDGKFVVGETITGATSKSTAKILVDDLGNTTPRLFITSQQKFITGETITGGTSNASAVVTRYRANPVQNIQQLLSYADTDNTIYDFLDNFRDEFMNAIPKTLAAGVDQRNLIKNIRELYRAKGTSEGHKIFMRMLLGEDPELLYPNQYMMRASAGNWNNRTIMRVAPGVNVIADEVVGQIITGQTSQATGVIVSASVFAEGATAIIEFELNPNSLSTLETFQTGEELKAISTSQDIPMTFTLKSIVSQGLVSSGGALYPLENPISFDTNANIGNGLATAKVSSIAYGSVGDIAIDAGGTLYEVGDPLVFTTTDSNTATAIGFVSIIDGALVLDGTSDYQSEAGDFLVIEDATMQSLVGFQVELEKATTGNARESLLLNGTDASSTNAGHNIDMEVSLIQRTNDKYGTGADRFAIEAGTDPSGVIARVFLQDGGAGYLTIPIVTVTSQSGTGQNLIATTDSIGAVEEVTISNQGFNYSSAPNMEFRANFTLADVSGTFELGNTLTTHTGTVVSFDSSSQLLSTSFEDVVRKTLETSDNESIALEDSLRVGSDVKDTRMVFDNVLTLEETLITEAGDRFVTEATDTLDVYIVLEDTTPGFTVGSAIVLESNDTFFNPPMQLELSTRDGTNIGNGIASEDGTDIIVSEESFSIGSPSYQLQRILGESSDRFVSVMSGIGEILITNASFDVVESGDFTGLFLLDATDSSGTDSGSSILNEEFGSNNNITMDGTDSDSTDAGAKLLQDVAAADGSVSIDGTDSSGTNAGDNIINESPIDFFEGATGINPFPTTITDSSGATAKIIKSNIAKGSSTIDVLVETDKSYGVNIESLIGEDLNRIQDSYYYQQFSYELSTGFSSESYLDQLKKAVHPAGWEVFSKVKISSAISAAIRNAGSALGGGYYSNLGVTAPGDTFSPILASTFDLLFAETVQFRLGVNAMGNVGHGWPNDKYGTDVFGDFEEAIILEEADTPTITGDSIVFNATDSSGTDAGSNIVEEQPFFLSSESIPIIHDTGANENGILTLNGTDSSSSDANERLVYETAVLLSNNLVLDSGPDSNHLVSSDVGSDILLNGVDASSTDAGFAIELEIASSDHINTIGRETVNAELMTVLNEDGGSQQLESSYLGGGADYDNTLVSFISVHVDIPTTTPKGNSTGLVRIVESPFIARGRISIEPQTPGAGSSAFLLLNADEFFTSQRINLSANFILEDATDPDYYSGFTFDNISDYSNDNLVLNGTDGSSTNDGDNLIFNRTHPDGDDAGDAILAESVYLYDHFNLADLIGNGLVLLDEGTAGRNSEGVLLEGSLDGGFFRQENETTASEHLGDKITLEDKTGFGFNNKLLVESDRLVLEESIVPIQNRTNSNVPHFTQPSSIMIDEYGGIDLEDNAEEVTNILMESSDGNEGFNLLYDGTDSSSTNAGSTIALEAFFNTVINYGEGAIVLNGTDGSSTNAGERTVFELGTDEVIRNLDFTPSEAEPGLFDSSALRFDSSEKSFDATI
jgi:hypothetical protein